MSNTYEIKKFYGIDLYKRIRQEIEASYECPADGRETGKITQELWQLLRDIRAGRKTIQDATSEKKVYSDEKERDE